MACSAREIVLKVAIFTRLMQSLSRNFELVSFFISSKLFLSLFEVTGLHRVRRAQRHRTDLLGNLAPAQMDPRMARRIE